MIKKVKDNRGQEYILIEFIVIDNKLKAILETNDGKFHLEDYNKIQIIK